MNLSVFGLGYVGAVSCGCFPELGHNVIGVDISEEKARRINCGESPIVESNLLPRIQVASREGRLRASTSALEAIRSTDAALLCVGTPSNPSGGLDGSHLIHVCEEIGHALRERAGRSFTVIVRSTCLPPLHGVLKRTLEAASQLREGDGFDFVIHPEFLREGVAVEDFFHPPKIVFGVSNVGAKIVCEQLYPNISAPVFFTTTDAAAMVKYADNCFHAVKVTFANEMGLICQQFGVDSHAVMEVFCSDKKLNISPRYLKPGAAFGGSCLPKDLRAVLDAARVCATPIPMLMSVLNSNRQQNELLLHRVASPSRPRVGIVGLAFKGGTDDVRESPTVSLVELLIGKGHSVSIYDRHLSIVELLGSNRSFALGAIPHLAELISSDLQAVVNDADVVVVAHRLDVHSWSKLRWRSGQRILDLINVPELKELPGYEGLYW